MTGSNVTVAMQTNTPQKKTPDKGAGSSALYAENRKQIRTKVVATGVALAVLAVFSLCTVPYLKGLISPLEVLSCYKLWAQQAIVSFTDPTNLLEPAEISKLCPTYYATMNQVAVTFITIVSGVALSVSGTLYQHVFRNPIASPTMLGVSGGINLGIGVMVLLFGVAAQELLNLRYLFTYGFVIIALAIIFIFGRLMSGKGRELNIINLLLVGTIVNQLIGVVITYLTWYVFDTNQFETYNYISEAISTDSTLLSLLLLTVGCVVAIIPIFLMRFRLNVLSFGEQDMKMLGVSPQRIRLVALICGTILIVSAQIHTGNVAMISLVVPFVSRFLFGAEFSKQFWGNILLGAALLLLCKCILLLLPFSLTTVMGVGPVVNFVVLPVFVWMIATQQRSWS